MKFCVTVAFLLAGGESFAPLSTSRVVRRSHAFHSSMASTEPVSSSTDDEFANFAATLEQDAQQQEAKKKRARKKSNSSRAGAASAEQSTKSWQNDLEEFLDPSTPPSQRQILLSDLMNANEEIRASVQSALRDRKIDPLLTPTGRKLQEGTRAVARQLTNDILPSLAQRPSSANTAAAVPFPLPPLPKPQDLSRVGNRLLNAVTKQMQQNLETLQSDLANPTRIPERITKQTEDFLQEASNVFSETPVGLKEPKYTLVDERADYEIRDYEAYTVATTNMDDDARQQKNNAAEQGVAFNTLASYIFGANAENRVMDMTTPVTTTMSGEMRFYVEDSAPDPLKQDESAFAYEEDKIRIERIPAARLAVRRFAGFATAGEVNRQKEALLAALELDSDDVELDVPHGQTVPHVVFQYNPPYTLPVLRRNEIAVPVMMSAKEEEEPTEDPWEVESSVNGASD